MLYYALRRLGLDTSPTAREPQDQQIVLLNCGGSCEFKGFSASFSSGEKSEFFLIGKTKQRVEGQS